MLSDVLVLHDSISRQYLVHGISGYLLIDTGLKNNYTKLIKSLTQAGVGENKLDLVIITHADGDHFGCLAQLMSSFPAAVTASSEVEAASINKGISSRPLKAKGIKKLLYAMAAPLFTCKPAEIRRILHPGDIFDYLGGLEILDTKGHTPEHISLWSKSTRTLFSGDSIVFNGRSLSPSVGSNTWDLELANSAFQLQMDLKPDRIYGGHGIWKRQ